MIILFSLSLLESSVVPPIPPILPEPPTPPSDRIDPGDGFTKLEIAESRNEVMRIRIEEEIVLVLKCFMKCQ